MSVKTFDLIPVIHSLNEKAADHAKIECVDYADGHIFLGTASGWIQRHSIHVSKSSLGRNLYRSKLVASKQIASKKPVAELSCIPNLNRVLYLCDNVLGMLDAATVEIVPSSSSKIKGVSRVSLNDRIDPENPFISYEVCVLKKRSLQIHSITEINFSLIVEISLPEPPMLMVYSEPFVCLASTSEYQIINVKENQPEVHNLFPYPDTPVILSMTDSETHDFLLSGPGGLGMFVSAQSLGAPRLPINWAELHVTRMQYASPYILVYSDADIWVYSSINQQPKQSLPFDKCQSLCRGDFHGKNGRLTPMMASATQVWALENIPWQEQVETLLEDRAVEEALQVARTFSSSEDDLTSLKSVLKRAAFVQLLRHDFTSAQELLLESEEPPEEVLKYCPDLLPSTDPFAEEPDNVFSPFSGGEISEGERNAFLLDYLDEYRRIVQIPPEINLVLLKLFALAKDSALLPFVKSYRNMFPYEETKALLERHHCYVALAFFELRIGHPDSALQWLTQLLDGQVRDDINGKEVDVDTIADILKSVEDGHVVLKHLAWLVKRDWKLAIDVLKTGHLKEASSVLLQLLDGCSEARIAFLEYLLFEENLKDDELYMKLADAYIDILTDSAPPTDTANGKPEVWTAQVRQKLQSLLLSDCLTDVAAISRRIEHTQLHSEKIILLGKAGEHLKALYILAHDMQDGEAAIEYCRRWGKGDRHFKRQLFDHLLAIYFNPTEQTPDAVQAALKLLNHEEADFEPIKVLNMLPANWPLSSLEGFLANALRRTLHTQRLASIECALAQREAYMAAVSVFPDRRKKIVLSDERLCYVCRRRFVNCQFNRLSDGRLLHLACNIPDGD